MRVEASKTMTRELKKAITGYEFCYIELNPDAYSWNVASIWDNEIDLKYTKEGKPVFRAIKVIYPPEFYAMPYYLTTRELNKIFRNSNKTLEGFMNEVKAAIEI